MITTSPRLLVGILAGPPRRTDIAFFKRNPAMPGRYRRPEDGEALLDPDLPRGAHWEVRVSGPAGSYRRLLCVFKKRTALDSGFPSFCQHPARRLIIGCSLEFNPPRPRAPGMWIRVGRGMGDADFARLVPIEARGVRGKPRIISLGDGTFAEVGA